MNGSRINVLVSGLTVMLVMFFCNTALAQDGKLPQLPSGPGGPGLFGACYTRLKYDDSWDAPWRIGPDADVVVRFDDGAHRFVFWHGTSYIPCWVTDTGIWYTDEFVERRGGSNGTRGCCEPMSDKQTRYSHVRIVENHKARVRVHWRYAPVDVNYRQPFVDQATGWGDWVDEYYTLYPDGTGIRHAALHTSEPMDWTEWQEAIVINQPGTMPDDNIERDALSLANMKGESKTFTWTTNGAPKLDAIVNPNIQIINLKAKRRPFQIVPPDDSKITAYRGHGKNSCFNFWNHWPVAQAASDCTAAKSANAPSHSSLSHISWKHFAEGEKSRSKVMMQGMTDKPAAGLLPLAKSWLSAPEIKLAGTGCKSLGYDMTERAYQLVMTGDNPRQELNFQILADKEHPVINPAFVIKNWGERGVLLTLGEKKAEPGRMFHSGHRNTLEGTDLIVWIKTESTEPVTIRLSPAE